jgi:hypothetical protein
MQIVVTGLVATYPFGGVFWDYIQYVLGLHRLGHRVLYVEDTGKWCYNPTEHTFTERGDENASYLAHNLTRLEPGLAGAWFYRDSTGHTFGRSWPDVVQFCHDADLFLHISASCWMREEYFAPRVVAFIDSDPMYTQESVRRYMDGTAEADEIERIEMLLRHDVHFTFAENIGEIDCRIPKDLFDWHPTRQPVVLDCFESARVPVNKRRRIMTTVASWEPTEDGPVVDGVQYHGKSVEFERMIDLPRYSPIPLELALSGKYPAGRLYQAGWRIVPAYQVSHDPWVYRDYISSSYGEWSVAKHAYAASRSGWFSCRSACYMAAGVPVIVQQTGFDRTIPTGGGLQTFSTLEESVEAIEELASRPDDMSDSALETARSCFDSRRVLTTLLETAFGAVT